MHTLAAVLLLAVTACPTAKTAVDGAALFAQAKAVLAAGRVGEHLRADAYQKAVDLLRQAARAGVSEAQFELGALVISTRYLAEGPQPAQRDTYVEALSWLGTAAHRGVGRAQSYLPTGVTRPLLGAPRPTPDAQDPEPMSDIPTAWITQAAAQAKTWGRCWPCTPTDARGLAMCATRESTVRLGPTAAGAIQNHPVLSGPTQQQVYGQLGDTQVIVVAPKGPRCRGAMRVQGRVEAVRGPRGYQGWAVRAARVQCE